MTAKPNKANAIEIFAERVVEKFSTHVTGEPEDQIRAPFEQLLREVGVELGIQEIVPNGEPHLANGLGRPVIPPEISCG